MSNKTISIVSMFVMACSLPLAQAAINGDTVSVVDLANQSKATDELKQVEDAAASIKVESDHLNAIVRQTDLSRDTDVDPLMNLRYEVNQMGKEIRNLDAQRQYLTPAETHALDALMPLAQSIAANTSNAIDYFNQNGSRLGTAIYQTYAGNVFKNSQKIEQILGNSVKYEKLRTQEAKLGERVQSEGE